MTDGEKRTDIIADNVAASGRIANPIEHLSYDLGEWIELYLKLQIEGVRAPQTLRAVRSDLRKFISFVKDHHGDADIRKWLPRVTQRFLDRLEELGQKPKTVIRALMSVRSFARWVRAARPELFPLGDPAKAAKPPTQEAIRPNGITDRQAQHLLDAAYHLICRTYPDELTASVEATREAWYRKAHRRIRRPFRDYAIIMLLLNGGLRRSEVCDLRLDQLQGRRLCGVKCKGNRYRELLLGEETVRAMESYLKRERPRDGAAFAGSEALFLPTASRNHRNRTGKLSPRTINVIVDRISAEANKSLPPEERITVHPHMFRHAHAYRILKKGRSLAYLQKRLGHQSMNYLALYAQMPEGEEKTLLDDAEFR